MACRSGNLRKALLEDRNNFASISYIAVSDKYVVFIAGEYHGIFSDLRKALRCRNEVYRVMHTLPQGFLMQSPFSLEVNTSSRDTAISPDPKSDLQTGAFCEVVLKRVSLGDAIETYNKAFFDLHYPTALYEALSLKPVLYKYTKIDGFLWGSILSGEHEKTR